MNLREFVEQRVRSRMAGATAEFGYVSPLWIDVAARAASDAIEEYNALGPEDADRIATIRAATGM
jgi:hypothetical protein